MQYSVSQAEICPIGGQICISHPVVPYPSSLSCPTPSHAWATRVFVNKAGKTGSFWSISHASNIGTSPRSQPTGGQSSYWIYRPDILVNAIRHCQSGAQRHQFLWGLAALLVNTRIFWKDTKALARSCQKDWITKSSEWNLLERMAGGSI